MSKEEKVEELDKETAKELQDRLQRLVLIEKIRSQNPGFILPHNLSIATPLFELNFFLRLAEEKYLIAYLREEITCLVARGGKLRDGLNYKECENVATLIVERNFLAEEVKEKKSMEYIGSLVQLMAQKMKLSN